jgi:hypothetical protein
MPLIAASAYADNICYEQSQCDHFEDCSSIVEVLEVYHKMVFLEHQEGVECDPSDPDYFLEFVQEAENLQKAWTLSNGQEDVFLELAKGLPGNCFELAETIVAGNYCDLRF